MAKIRDLFRGKRKTGNFIEDEEFGRIELPSSKVMEKLEKAPILKKYLRLMSEFPHGNIGNQLDSLNSFLSAHSKKELQVKIIRNLMEDIRRLDRNITVRVEELYSIYRKGHSHIQEMYTDFYSEIKDSPRMEKRIAGLQKVKKKMDEFLSEELGNDQVIQNHCKDLYAEALRLKNLCLVLLGREVWWVRWWSSIKMKKFCMKS